MIINTNKKDHKDIPKSLNGEVLLEKIIDTEGNFLGYVTAPVETVVALRTKSDDELKACGWFGYKHIIKSIK